MNVLVVEDESVLRELVAAIIKGLGHEVTEAENSDEAIRLLKSNSFHVVVTDNDMPRTKNDKVHINEGLAIIESVRSSSNPPYVIFTSGRVACDRQLADTARALGACEILPKPFYVEELRAILARIETHRMMETVPI